MKQIALFAAPTGAIDVGAGVIRGVSVITVGEAKGHGVFIDATTLEQVARCASGYEGGLKCKADHWTGFNEIVGALRDFAVDGEQVRADLHLLDAHPMRDRILEMAEEMPDAFGLSIVFSGEPEEIEMDAEVEGQTIKLKRTYARCTEIYSCDLVDSPAANPSGLFSRMSCSTLELEKARSEIREHMALMDRATAEINRLSDELAARDQAIMLETERVNGLETALETERAARQHDIDRREKQIALLEGLARVSPPPQPTRPAPAPQPENDPAALWERYRAITEPRARTEFYRKHREQMRAV